MIDINEIEYITICPGCGELPVQDFECEHCGYESPVEPLPTIGELLDINRASEDTFDQVDLPRFTRTLYKLLSDEADSQG